MILYNVNIAMPSGTNRVVGKEEVGLPVPFKNNILPEPIELNALRTELASCPGASSETYCRRRVGLTKSMRKVLQ